MEEKIVISREAKVVIEWVLKVKVMYDFIKINLVVRYTEGNSEKELDTIGKIANSLEKVYNIRSSRIEEIIRNNIRNIYYISSNHDYIHEKVIIIDDGYFDNLNSYLKEIREDVRKVVSEINKVSRLVNDAKSRILPEYILYSDIK